MDAAANYLTASIEPLKASRLVAAWKWTVAALEVALGMGDGIAPSDLVVRRIDTGREVLRTRANVGSPDYLLDEVRRDLATKTVDDFIAEWRLRDEDPESSAA